MPLDVRDLKAQEIVEALRAADIPDDWDAARVIRSLEPSACGLDQLKRGTKASDGFRNQVVGRIAEGVFRSTQLAPLESEGFNINDYVARGDNRDFGLQESGSNAELPINVKTASTLFRNAKSTVGLDPHDCVPLPAYKAINALGKVPDLVYVDLVDFALREKADAFISNLRGEGEILWDLMSWYGGRGAKKAQDEFTRWLFSTHQRELEALVADATKFRVISARRVLAIMRDNPRRVPGLGIKAAGTGGFVAEVNVHVSVQRETMAWSDVLGTIRRDGLETVLALIRHEVSRTVPDPLL